MVIGAKVLDSLAANIYVKQNIYLTDTLEFEGEEWLQFLIFEASRAVDGDCIDPAFFPARTDAPGGIDCLMTLLLCFNLLEESESLSLEDKKVNISYYDKLFLAFITIITIDILYIPGSNTRRIR